MTAKRLSLLSLSAIVSGSFSLWVSFGTLAVTRADAGATRLGVLPSVWWLAAAFVIISTAVLVAGNRRAGLLWLSVVVLLPWLPIPVPEATYIWTGPLRWGVWFTIAIAAFGPGLVKLARAAGLRAFADSRRAPYLAAALAATTYLLTAWQVAPQLPGGDEPHYLVIAQSLLKEGDLKIENNHQRGDYHEYFTGPLKPDYLARGLNGAIYSIHAPGLPAVIAPVFAVFGYPGVLAFLAIVAGCATGLAWFAVWLVTCDIAASWFGWATVSLTVPFLFQAFTVYPDGFAAALMMAGLLTALLRERASPRILMATGSALALLPWLHTRFAVTAGTLGLVIIARQFSTPDRVRRMTAFAAVPVISALTWFGFFYVIYGSPNPAVAYRGYTQSAVANIPRGLTGFLFDQQFGLLPNAPVYLCAFLGFVPLARRQPRLAGELMLVSLPYTLVAALFFMWWGGFVAPARFLASILLPLAIPAGAWFAAARPAMRVFGLGTLALSVMLSATTAVVGRGELLYNTRDGASKLLAWAAPLVNLTTGVPSLFQTGPAAAVARAAIWLVAAAAIAGLAWWLDRRRTSMTAASIAIGLAAPVAAMTALSLVWTVNAAQPLTPGKAGPGLLRAIDGDGGQRVVRYSPLGRMRAADTLPLLPLLSPIAHTGRPSDPLVLISGPSAATYTIEADITGDAGSLTAGIDRQPGPLWTWDLSSMRGKFSQSVTLVNDAETLRLDGDAATRRAIGDINIRAVRRLTADERVSELEAQRAARYGRATVFLLRGLAYIEPGGSWIAPGSVAEFAIARDAGAPIQLFVRNSAIDNHVVLESGRWRQDLALKPREERMVDVPIDANRPGLVLRVRSAAGARPSDTEPGNQDRRLLGCWIETR